MIALLFLILGLAIGWFGREQVARHKIESIIRQAESAKPEVKEKIKVPVYVEKHKKVFYVYEEVTNKFLIQGPSKELIARELLKLHPEKIFVVYEDNANEVGFK